MPNLSTPLDPDVVIDEQRPVNAQELVRDLENIAARARRTLADPSKSRWHREERDLLGRIEREISRLRGAPH